MKIKINIAGIHTPNLVKCLVCARELQKLYPDEVQFVEKDNLSVLFPTQWDQYMKNLQNKQKGDFYDHKGNLIVFLNNHEYIGTVDSFLEWALQEFIYIDNTSNFIYTKLSNDMYSKLINQTEGRSYVWFDLAYRGSSGSEQVVMELFEDTCPKTCENFKRLCQGYKRPDGKIIGYAGTKFDRVVKGKFIQGGDIGAIMPDDDGPFSTFEDGHFADESFSNKHKEIGLLGMSKEMGYAGTNECQFYITTAAPLSFMDNKNVVFGRVINGMRSINMIQKVECFNQKPSGKVQIKSCGIYDGTAHLSRSGKSRESTRQRVGVKMVQEPGLDNNVIDEKKEYFQGFLNKEEFKEFHIAQADMEICNEALTNLKIDEVKALIEKEKPNTNFEKSFECAMMLVGGQLTGKELIQCNYQMFQRKDDRAYKFFTKKFKDKEAELLGNMKSFNHLKPYCHDCVDTSAPLDDKTFDNIQSIMIANGLDEKQVKAQAKPQAAIITWSIASYYYMRAIRKAKLQNDGEAYIEYLAKSREIVQGKKDEDEKLNAAG